MCWRSNWIIVGPCGQSAHRRLQQISRNRRRNRRDGRRKGGRASFVYRNEALQPIASPRSRRSERERGVQRGIFVEAGRLSASIDSIGTRHNGTRDDTEFDPRPHPRRRPHSNQRCQLQTVYRFISNMPQTPGHAERLSAALRMGEDAGRSGNAASENRVKCDAIRWIEKRKTPTSPSDATTPRSGPAERVRRSGLLEQPEQQTDRRPYRSAPHRTGVAYHSERHPSGTIVCIRTHNHNTLAVTPDTVTYGGYAIVVTIIITTYLPFIQHFRLAEARVLEVSSFTLRLLLEITV
ncbi:unnamed protein product [Phyllotreta striolata]|uniref:Uncharacterized protein n=1 Tax=Phyllotreta striolata TaxID=444603 RepID=A0A9N9TVC3_PHYSR|nr:unnamed protein product [Phyllotreta striolata]